MAISLSCHFPQSLKIIFNYTSAMRRHSHCFIFKNSDKGKVPLFYPPPESPPVFVFSPLTLLSMLYVILTNPLYMHFCTYQCMLSDACLLCVFLKALKASYYMYCFVSGFLAFKINDIFGSYCGSAVTNLTSTHEDVGSIPGPAQWVKDLALL